MTLAASVSIACAGFLLAVLWIDLMFDVQVAAHEGAELPEPVLASIAAYYARVTTQAAPMGRAIAVAMLALLGAVAYPIVAGGARWHAWVSLALCVVPVGLARVRIVPNAARLGRRVDDVAGQSALARAIHRDHWLCLAALLAFLALRLVVGAAEL